MAQPRNDLQELLERRQMQVESLQHDIQRFFDEMTKEQMVVLRFIFSHCAEEDHYASYMEGIAAAILHHKFGVCSCGKDHAQELMDAARAEELSRWGLVEDPDGTIKCATCGMHYASLEARTQSKPGSEGCQGCIQKTKWG